jgi:hypothetical protein
MLVTTRWGLSIQMDNWILLIQNMRYEIWDGGIWVFILIKWALITVEME